MKRILVEYELLSFDELSEKAKKLALEKFNEHNWFDDILQENMNQWLLFKLEENNINVNVNSFEIFYSLSYSQGDGVCFVGTFEWKGFNITIGQYGRYFHSRAVEFDIVKEHEDEEYIVSQDIYDEWTELYRNICADLEKNGYETIEYETSEANFKEICEINDYMFYDSGNMFYKFNGKVINDYT